MLGVGHGPTHPRPRRHRSHCRRYELPGVKPILPPEHGEISLIIVIFESTTSRQMESNDSRRVRRAAARLRRTAKTSESMAIQPAPIQSTINDFRIGWSFCYPQVAVLRARHFGAMTNIMACVRPIAVWKKARSSSVAAFGHCSSKALLGFLRT